VLSVADEEGGDALGLYEGDEGVDVGVEVWLADEGEGAVSDSHCFGEEEGEDLWDAFHHFDILVVACFCAGEDQIRGVGGAAPGCAYGIGAVAPAEDAFVAAREGGCGFHAEMGLDAVEGVFVAGSAAAEGGFGLAVDLNA
jgi:hypothetical protein